jgi:Pyruvate/2-oxoacid:ferredoxin oxidoreductase gamma subunit
MQSIASVNDFVVKFANVNGSGSASANALFAKAILRMGVPVSPRNIFPSNIQGLPTWYEVRVSERGWLGRRGGVDLMVAMNPQTWEKDVAEIEPGGYLFYDSTKPLPPSKFREDIHVIGMPLMEICNATYSDPRQRQLFKNIIYVGRARRRCSTSTCRVREAHRRAVQGQGEAARAQHQGAAHGPRLRARPPGAAGDQGAARQPRRQPHLHRGQQCRGAGMRLRGCHGRRRGIPITPSSSLGRRRSRSTAASSARIPHEQGPLRRRAGRGRARLDRHRDRRRRGTGRAHSRARRARHLAHAGIHRLAYFAEIPA